MILTIRYKTLTTQSDFGMILKVKFWNEFGNLVKEGAATDFTYREDLAKLLRFESTAMDAGKLTGFDNYIDRMASDQKEILFLSSLT